MLGSESLDEKSYQDGCGHHVERTEADDMENKCDQSRMMCAINRILKDLL